MSQQVTMRRGFDSRGIGSRPMCRLVMLPVSLEGQHGDGQLVTVIVGTVGSACTQYGQWTSRVGWNVPAFGYVCVGFAQVDVALQAHLNCHKYVKGGSPPVTEDPKWTVSGFLPWVGHAVAVAQIGGQGAHGQHQEMTTRPPPPELGPKMCSEVW